MELSLGARVLFAVPALWAAKDLIRLDDVSRKIPNRRLAAYALCLVAVYAAAAFLGGGDRDFLILSAKNAGAAAAAAVALWRLGVWPAGDAKLFVLLSIWVPPLDPESPLLPWMSVASGLINIFIPAAFFILLKALWWSRRNVFWGQGDFLADLGGRRFWDYSRRAAAALYSRRDLSGFLRAIAGQAPLIIGASAAGVFGAKAAGGALLCFYALGRAGGGRVARVASWILALSCAGFALQKTGAGPFVSSGSRWLMMSVFFSLGDWTGRALLSAPERGLLLAALFSALLGTALLGVLGLIEPWGAAVWAWFCAVCGILRQFLTAYLKDDEKTIRAVDVHAGIVLAESSAAKLRADEDFFEEKFGRFYPDGLTAAQAEELRIWCARRGVDQLAVKTAIPFAAWVFAGTGLTVLLRTDVLFLLLKSGHG